MQALFILALLLGLILGVRAMLVGIKRTRRRLRASPFNLPTVGAWCTTFGMCGYLLTRYTSLGIIAVLAVAALVGLAAAVGVYALIAGWALPATAREVEDERYALQGHVGYVTKAIESDGMGEIAYEHNGVRHLTRARGLHDQSIAAASEIVIERVEDGVAYVELWSTIEKQLQLPS